MLELNIPEVEKLKVTIGGKSYDCRPFVMKDIRSIRSFQGLLQSEDEAKLNEGLDKMIDAIAAIGIPKDVLEALSIQSFNMLVEHLVGAEKK